MNHHPREVALYQTPNSSKGPSPSQTNARASSFGSPGLCLQTTAPFFSQHSTSAWKGEEGFLNAPALHSLGPSLTMNAASLLRGCRSGPGKKPEPGLFRGGMRKGEWVCTAPRGDLEGGSSDISIERLSQGEGKRRAPKSELIAAAQQGIQGSSQGIVHRLLSGKWPVDSD